MDFVDGSGLWVVSDTLDTPPDPPVESRWDTRSYGRRIFSFFLIMIEVIKELS